MSGKSPYTKKYKCAADLISLLKERGLAFTDIHKAEQYLKTISYYRLSAYMYPLIKLPKSQNKYKSGSTFSQVMLLYRFDKKLRLFLFNEIEKIEIAIRTTIIDECTVAYNDPFWITNPNNYIDKNKYQRTRNIIDNELSKSHEDFIEHFKETYSNNYPPAWILVEILPIGVLTNLFFNLNNSCAKKKVSLRFGLQVPVFTSWITIVTLTRNACCHHSRVWNKQNTIIPMVPKRIGGQWITLHVNPLRIYFDICIIKYFLNIISPDNNMTNKLKNLLSEYPIIDLSAMGFPKGWESEPLWSNI